jgi:hypothetical protein
MKLFYDFFDCWSCHNIMCSKYWGFYHMLGNKEVTEPEGPNGDRYCLACQKKVKKVPFFLYRWLFYVLDGLADLFVE